MKEDEVTITLRLLMFIGTAFFIGAISAVLSSTNVPYDASVSKEENDNSDDSNNTNIHYGGVGGVEIGGGLRVGGWR